MRLAGASMDGVLWVEVMEVVEAVGVVGMVGVVETA